MRNTNRKNHFDTKYFSEINDERKAYFLGIMYSDGNIYKKRNRIQITFQNEDTYLLEQFAQEVKSTAKLYNDRNKYRKIILDSKEMVEDLEKLGCTSRKAHTLKFSEDLVEKQLMSHFIRGYFDGDGSISKTKKYAQVNISGCSFFLVDIKKYLESNDIDFSRFYPRYEDKKDGSGSIVLQRRSFKSFREYMYRDATIFMKRKHDKFYD